MSTRDPFVDLTSPLERQTPRRSFARDLRGRVRSELGLDDEPPPTISLPERNRIMSTTAAAATAVTPYLTVHDAAAALEWYASAFGAVERMRIVGDDDRVGHAEFAIGQATFYLSDEYPDIGVTAPHTIGGTAASLHLQVGDVDTLFARAVEAGATAQMKPADQSHGARHGSMFDPFGHRWMLSQHVEEVDTATYAERLADSEFSLAVGDDIPGVTEAETIAAASRPGTGGGIWAGAFYVDALAGIRFGVDVLGFEEQIVVLGEDGTTVVHSQLRWPEGGIVQFGTYDADNPFVHEPGAQSLYVVTMHPDEVWERCQAAGVEVLREPEEPAHAPGTMSFAIRDPEGNIWSFGQYGADA